MLFLMVGLELINCMHLFILSILVYFYYVVFLGFLNVDCVEKNLVVFSGKGSRFKKYKR